MSVAVLQPHVCLACLAPAPTGCQGQSGGCTASFQLIAILVSELCCACEGGLVLTSCLMGALRFSLLMSSSQPGGLVSQELIPSVKKGLGCRGVILQWSSECTCPAGRREGTATAAQERQRGANSRGRDGSHLAPGASIGTVLGSKRCHGSTSGSSLGAAAGAQPLPGTGWCRSPP